MDYTFDLPVDIASVLRNYDLSDSVKAELLTIAINDLGEHLQTMLLPYMSEARATIYEDSIQVQEESLIIKDALNGTVVIEFKDNLWMGCRDIGGDSEHEPEISFSLDISPEHPTITLTGMDYQERDPDDL